MAQGAKELPPELWENVFHFLPSVSDACSMRLICKQWKAVVDQESFWEHKVKDDFPLAATSSSSLTWKELYQELASLVWNDEQLPATLHLENNNRTLSHQGDPSDCSVSANISKQKIVVVSNNPQLQSKKRFYFWEVCIDKHGDTEGMGLDFLVLL